MMTIDILIDCSRYFLGARFDIFANCQLNHQNHQLCRQPTSYPILLSVVPYEFLNKTMFAFCHHDIQP
jgi:hypothetical protein